MSVTLSDLEEAWESSSVATRSSLLSNVAGWVPSEEYCPWCGNNHSAKWLNALLHEDRPEVLRDWLISDDGNKTAILSGNPELEPVLRMHLEAKVSALNEPNRPSRGVRRDLIDVYAAECLPRRANTDQTNGAHQTRHLSGWQEIGIALGDDSLPDGPPSARAVAGVLELQTVGDGTGDIYPVCCQTFIIGDKSFQQSVNSIFELVPRELWSKRRDVHGCNCQPTVDFRWRIRSCDGRPLRAIKGRSLELAWAMAASNLFLKTHDEGWIHINGNTELCEISLANIAASAQISQDGSLDTVSARTINFKKQAVTRAKTQCLVVCSTQEGIDERGGSRVLRCSRPYDAWNSIYVCQAETLFNLMLSRRVALQFVVLGCPEVMLIATLLTVTLWAAFTGVWFEVPFAGIIAGVAFWPWNTAEGYRTSRALLLPSGETRTSAVWAKMAVVVASRIRRERAARRGASLLAATTLTAIGEWLARGLSDCQATTRQTRLTSDDLLTVIRQTSRTTLTSQTGVLSVIVFLIVSVVLLSPLQSQLAEWLPPWAKPEIRGGSTSRLADNGATLYAPLRETSREPWPVFVAVVGSQGEIVISADDKQRVSRSLRVQCDTCTVFTRGRDSLTVTPMINPIPVIKGTAAFSYFVVANVKATLSLQLLDARGHQLAIAVVELQR